MNQDETSSSGSAFEHALDTALARALRAPIPPGDFRTRVDAALRRAAESDGSRPAARARLEREQREQLAQLRAGYLRLRRRTFASLVGGAFAAGAAAALLMPWLEATFGPNALLLLAVGTALAGLAIVASYWTPRGGLAGRL